MKKSSTHPTRNTFLVTATVLTLALSTGCGGNGADAASLLERNPASSKPSAAEPAQPTPEGFDSLSIFYGNPTRKRLPWGDIRVLPEAVQFSQHSGWAEAKRVLQTAPKLGCGYIPLGAEPRPSIEFEYHQFTTLLTMQQFQNDIVRWKAMGANCIFVDTAGKDYGNDEARMMQAHTLIHAAGMHAIWNAWNPQDMPWHRFGAMDHFLFESSQTELGRLNKLQYWKTHHPVGAQAFAVTTRSLSGAEREELIRRYQAYDVNAVQWRDDDVYSEE